MKAEYRFISGTDDQPRATYCVVETWFERRVKGGRSSTRIMPGSHKQASHQNGQMDVANLPGTNDAARYDTLGENLLQLQHGFIHTTNRPIVDATHGLVVIDMSDLLRSSTLNQAWFNGSCRPPSQEQFAFLTLAIVQTKQPDLEPSVDAISSTQR